MFTALVHCTKLVEVLLLMFSMIKICWGHEDRHNKGSLTTTLEKLLSKTILIFTSGRLTSVEPLILIWFIGRGLPRDWVADRSDNITTSISVTLPASFHAWMMSGKNVQRSFLPAEWTYILVQHYHSQPHPTRFHSRIRLQVRLNGADWLGLTGYNSGGKTKDLNRTLCSFYARFVSYFPAEHIQCCIHISVYLIHSLK